MIEIYDLVKQKFTDDKFSGIRSTLETIEELKKRIERAVRENDYHWVNHYSENLRKEQEKLSIQKETLRQILYIIEEAGTKRVTVN